MPRYGPTRSRSAQLGISLPSLPGMRLGSGRAGIVLFHREPDRVRSITVWSHEDLRGSVAPNPEINPYAEFKFAFITPAANGSPTGTWRQTGPSIPSSVIDSCSHLFLLHRSLFAFLLNSHFV